MFKTIRSRMIVLQTIMIVLIVCSLFVFFINFADNYYFIQKEKLIDKAYKKLEHIDISHLVEDSSLLNTYEEQNLKFVICDSYFYRIYVTGKKNKPVDAQDLITSKIVKKIDKFTNEYRKENRAEQISGYGIVDQNDEHYYVFIYENKLIPQMQFSYFKIFYLIIGGIMILAGIIVSFYTANKISKPIRNLEREARNAVNSGYSIRLDKDHKLNEINSLAESINFMLSEIRNQMLNLQTEIEEKTDLENQRRQFVNNVSHEMKTPLAIMSSQIEMLQYIEDDKKRQKYCSSLMEEILNMSTMINDMIVMYSAKGENGGLVMQDKDISEIVMEVCNRYENIFAKKGIILLIDAEQNCVARVNERYINQAIDNYISNAIKNSLENGQIKIEVKKTDRGVNVSVENRGEHLEEEEKTKIWDMFYSGHHADGTQMQKSSGIGLCIVKDVMEIHGGTYGCENTKDGVRFWIEIPIME